MESKIILVINRFLAWKAWMKESVKGGVARKEKGTEVYAHCRLTIVLPSLRRNQKV